MLLRTLTLAAAAAFLLLGSAAAAKPKIPHMPKLEQKRFVLEKATAERKIEWHDLPSATPDAACADYVESSGLERTDVTLDERSPHLLTVSGRNAILAPTGLAKFSGTVTREFTEKPRESSCADCGGELGECGGAPQQGPQLPSIHDYDCGIVQLVSPHIPIVMKPKSKKQADDDLLAPEGTVKDRVGVELSDLGELFDECPPTQTGGPGLPTLQGARGVNFEAQYRKILDAKPGQTITLNGSNKIGHTKALGDHGGGKFTGLNTCPSLSGSGRQVCDTLSVEVTLRRVK